MTGSIPLWTMATAWSSWALISSTLDAVGRKNAVVSGAATRTTVMTIAIRLAVMRNQLLSRYETAVQVMMMPSSIPAATTNCHGTPEMVGRSNWFIMKNANANPARPASQLLR